MVFDRLSVGDCFVARDPRVGTSRGGDVVLPDAGRINAEHRNESLQVVTLASRASRFGFQNQGFELLPAVEAFEVV